MGIAAATLGPQGRSGPCPCCCYLSNYRPDPAAPQQEFADQDRTVTAVIERLDQVYGGHRHPAPIAIGSFLAAAAPPSVQAPATANGSIVAHSLPSSLTYLVTERLRI